MNILNLSVTSNAKTLATVAELQGNKVKFATGNEVAFKSLDRIAHLKYVRVNWSTTTVFQFSVPTFTQEEQDYLVAAMLVVGIRSFIAGPTIVGLDDSSDPVAPKVTRCATDFEGAQKYGISQHARQRQERYIPTAQEEAVLVRRRQKAAEEAKADLIVVGAFAVAALAFTAIRILASKD